MAAVLFAALPLWVAPARAAEPPSIALFGFELINTSLQQTTPEEQERLRRLGDQLRAALEQSGEYRVLDTAPVAADPAKNGGIRECNGCERELARRLGAAEAAYGWVQKVSNLILNINLVIEDAASGKVLKAGSVDIRGNTDESWTRGLKFLLEERVFDH